eukprot:Plantae.Rhodophyta-Hildenbrandia_rubra.ctg1980.p1 GENE.Plantae.Rhodophyta-Hildenbrandia_rubra.ctg1980~~Plantae.Rhodophyta-Hildenbrandia_rubra.ctg1980.p1  ORF type:complete len:386 (-),score=58.84 Plantae.Rhodophyta-Hildenbrandia_rubra.ctg1980:581-1738(-)
MMTSEAPMAFAVPLTLSASSLFTPEHHCLVHPRRPPPSLQILHYRRRPRSPLHTHPNSYKHPHQAPTSLQLPPTVGHTIHHPSGTNIYIIGCVHGSKLSAQDVKNVCENVAPSAVVLELCAPRLRSLMTDMGENDDTCNKKKMKKKNSRLRLSGAVERFGGLGPAILALGLLSMSSMQRVVGLDPGGEFKVGVRIGNRLEVPVLCGDVLGNETVKRLAEALGFRGLKKGLRVILRGLGKVSRGEFYFPEGRVRLERVLLDWKRMWELIWIVGPVFGVSFVFSRGFVLAGTLLGAGQSVHAEQAFSMGMLAGWSMFSRIFEWASIAYTVLATTSFVQALVVERDVVLARNISDACKLYGGKQKDVVAIVGLLHVNGILRALDNPVQ